MRVLTLREPWATMVARYGKTIENRGYRTNYRGPLAIHAAKTIRVRDCRDQLEAIRLEGWVGARRLPTLDELRSSAGKIVAVCDLVDCRLASSFVDDEPWVMRSDDPNTDWCWVLANVRDLARPVPHVGNQGGPRVLDARTASAVRASLAVDGSCGPRW